MSQPTSPTSPPRPAPGLAPLSAAELQQIESVFSASKAGRERGWFDPTTGALSGTRPVADQGDLASVTAIRRHGG